MKRFLVLLLALMMVLSLAACGQKPAEEPEKPAEEATEEATEETTEEAEKPAEVNYKIGLMTGTVSQGEEEFRAGEALKKEMGDALIHVTYPDKFGTEQETTISNMKSMAADPDVKAIIVCQAVTGVSAGIDAVRESRPDMLVIAGAPHDDPEVIAARADICLDLDQYQRGVDIMATSKDMGAKTFIHYSFPRHMSYPLLAARRDELKKAAAEAGIEFVEIDAPDPTGDAGMPGAQQFILEDVPRQVEKYGKETAFFSTNCGMQEPLIKAVLDQGALYPEQCCPSPYHAYPNALGIKIPEDKAGDLDYLNAEITKVLEEKGGTGRFATWKKPANVAMINAGVEYAKAFAEGKVANQDMEAMTKYLQEATDGDITIKPLEGHDNFLMFTIGSQRF